jgi:hypothetical protein
MVVMTRNDGCRSVLSSWAGETKHGSSSGIT